MEMNPIANDARLARRERRLPDDYECLLCQIRAPEVLLRFYGDLIEFHHLAGYRNDSQLGVMLCLNCHAIATEAQRRGGVELGRAPQPCPLARLISWLAGVGVFLHSLAHSAARLAGTLRDLLRFLNEKYPGWRDAFATWQGGAA
jgi:hypothetical protein